MSGPVQVVEGSRAVVSSGHEAATAEALRIFREGGNAVDAAVAGAAVLAVVLPYACGLGGDAFVLIHDSASRRTYGLNGTGRAPESAGPDVFGDGIPANGPASVTVPGMVAAWADAVERFGSRPLSVLLESAIEHAETGFPAHRELVRNATDRAAVIANDPGASAVFLPGGTPPHPGEAFRQPDLAETLRRISRDGVAAFYSQSVAREMVQALGETDGRLSLKDLAAHESTWQEPLTARFYDHDVTTMPPNSWGLGLLLQLVALEADRVSGIRPGGPEFAERGIAARTAAHAAARGVIADPEVAEAPARRLLAECARARAVVAGDRSTGSEPEGPDTAGIVVMDANGNAVSMLQSISAPFGSGIVPPGTGVVLNNRMRGFVIDPGSPNCVGPRRRPAHTLAPVLVHRDGQPVMSIATPGAPGQTCVVAQVLARVIGCGQAVEEAIAAPRWSVDLAGKIVVEEDADEAVKTAVLERHAGARVVRRGWQTCGSVKLVSRAGGRLIGAADGRRVASTAGW